MSACRAFLLFLVLLGPLAQAQEHPALTIRGLKPGLSRTQVHKLLGNPSTTEPSRETYPGLELRYGADQLIGITGSRLECNGELLFSAGEARQRALEQLEQHLGPGKAIRHAVYYENLPFEFHVRFQEDKVLWVSMARRKE